MNDLLQTRIFGLLNETSQEITNEEMQNAYGEFIHQVRTMSNENDYSTIYRILVATRIEIASLETAPLYGQGENALKNCSYKNIGYNQCRIRTVQSENPVPKPIPYSQKQLSTLTTLFNRRNLSY